MRAVVERVSEARVDVDGQTVGRVGNGLLVYLGVAVDDTDADAAALAEKIAGLRIFSDAQGSLNLSVIDVGGGVLVISAFTTQADARKGRRPSFDRAARPEQAEPLYRTFCETLRACGVAVETGQFRAMMQVHAVNDGPICILLDSRRAF